MTLGGVTVGLAVGFFWTVATVGFAVGFGGVTILADRLG